MNFLVHFLRIPKHTRFFPAGIALIALLFTASVGAQQPGEPASGDELARELREMQPEANTTISGLLQIRADKRRANIPVVSKVITNENSWKIVYETSATENVPAEKLVVIRSENAPNNYFYARAATPTSPLPELKPLPPPGGQHSACDFRFLVKRTGI